MRGYVRSAILTGLIVAAGCASAGGGSTSGNRNRITAEQIGATRAQNAYQVIEQLQPGWLTTRGPQDLTDPNAAYPTASVYIDGSRAGDLEFLKGVPVAQIAEIRYYPASEASARFGMGHVRGVIEIINKGT